MYLKDFQEEKEDDNNEVDDDAEEERAKEKRNKFTKGKEPREIMGNGPLYRVILVYSLQELRPLVLPLVLNPEQQWQNWALQASYMKQSTASL